VKTSNILLTAEGSAKVADVGLATMADHFSSARTAGTFLYAAPEILMGQPSTFKVHRRNLGGKAAATRHSCFHGHEHFNWEVGGLWQVTELTPRLREIQT